MDEARPFQRGSNREIFNTIELEKWAHQRKSLWPAEKYFIERYLDKRGKTLEAGTGNGRILFAMKALGFSSLFGFDFAHALIEEAKKADKDGSINFQVQDASCLNYEDSSFDQLIYLQQIVCMIENEVARRKALQEAYRVLKSGGTGLFSFLSFEARSRSLIYLSYLSYTRLFRKLRGSGRTIQCLPWLRLNGKFNFRCLVDAGPYVYWYRLKEIDQILKDIGFHIIAVGSDLEIDQASMAQSYEKVKEPTGGMLYIVTRK